MLEDSPRNWEPATGSRGSGFGSFLKSISLEFCNRTFTQICSRLLLHSLGKEENNLVRPRPREATMVSKCANPECTTPFLYFHRGRLFRVETEGRQERRRNLGGETGAGKPLRRIEFYWLC